jgi:parvulin-like peptidyl-prolyl isomerase
MVGSTTAGAEVVDRIVLRINDQIATSLDYEFQLADRRQAIRMAEMPEDRRSELMEEVGLQVFREIYEDLLLRSRAHQLGLFATEAEVAAAVQNSRERMGITTDEEMEQALRASGMTLEQLEDKMRASILVQQVVGREIRSKIEIGDEALRKVYREREEELTVPEGRWVEEVVIREEQTPSAEDRRQLVADLRREIEAGESFAEVVGRWAETGVTSGVVDLGWVERGHLATDLDEALWAMEEGEFTEPIEAGGGTHLLHVVESREAAVRPFDEVRDGLLASERDRRMADAYTKYLRDLEESSFIQMTLPPEAGGFEGLSLDSTARTE